MAAGHDEWALRLVMKFAGFVRFTETRSETASEKLHKERKGLLTRCSGQDSRWLAQKGPAVRCYQTEASQTKSTIDRMFWEDDKQRVLVLPYSQSNRG
jgi:hypothetical protein